MKTINRSIAVIRLKQPFVDWVNSFPYEDKVYTVESFRDDCTAVLIPEYDTDQEAKDHINEVWEELFEDELEGWYTDESLWPEDRTQGLFWQWFEVEFHSMVLDPYQEAIEWEDL
jgi:hypothetical protein